MNYLQLCQRLRQEIKANGTGPDTVIVQSGELKRIVDWISESDQEVQQEHNEWKFMVGDFSLNTVASDGSYTAADCITPITDLRDWKRDKFKCYLLSAGVGAERELPFIDYDAWYAIYNTGTQNPGQPVCFTVDNDMSIKLGPIPNDVYRITGKYGKSVTAMTADASTPPYPSEFHLIAVYLGMMKYGRYTGSSEVYQDGERLYKKMLRRMERTQLPEIRMGGPLA